MMRDTEPEQPSRIVVNSNVTVKRAPTDESVRILNEMQDEARKNILGSFPIADNGFEGDIHFWLEPHNDKTVGICRFKLNGRQYEARASIDNWRERDRQVLVNRLRDDVAAKITVEILNDAFSRLSYESGFILNR